MPAAMPSSVLSSPMPSRDTSAAASSKETSVKTAIARGSEAQDVPDPLAGRAAARPRAVRHVARPVGRDDLVALLDRTLRRDGDALHLPAHPQLVDPRPVVLDHGVLHVRLRPYPGRGRIVRLHG